MARTLCIGIVPDTIVFMKETRSNEHEATIDSAIAEASEAHLLATLKVTRYIRTIKNNERNGHTWGQEDNAKKLAEAEEVAGKTLANLRVAEAKYEGWSRFFIVRTNNGHIHRSMSCSTCNRNGKATEFGWLPELSGLSEAEAVEAEGSILCTVCFPSAPVEWTNGEAKWKTEEKEARANEKAVKALPDVKKWLGKVRLVESKVQALRGLHSNIDFAKAMDRSAEEYRTKVPKVEKQLARAEKAEADLRPAAKEAVEAAGLKPLEGWGWE